MKNLIWILTAAIIGLWSLLAWITHGLVSVAGNLVANNADRVTINTNKSTHDALGPMREVFKEFTIIND